MVLREQREKVAIRERRVVRSHLSPTELVTGLCPDRGRCGGDCHRGVQLRLLPLLLQTTTTKVHGRPRPCPKRPLSCPAAITVCAQHTRTFLSTRWRLACTESRQLQARGIHRRRRGAICRCRSNSTASTIPPASTTDQGDERDTKDATNGLYACSH